MSWLGNDVLDAALNRIKNNCENLYLCSTEPTTFAQASSTYKLGTKASPGFTGPADRTGGGRDVTINAITDGTVNGTGTAGFWALTDDSASELLAVGSLSATQGVTSGNVFSLTSMKIGIPDPA